MAVPLIKPVPVTVSVVAPEPALRLAGEIDETVGAAAVGGVGVVPLLDEEAQPAKNGTNRPRKGARERLGIRMTDLQSLAPNFINTQPFLYDVCYDTIAIT
jgi:hypothetical protein